MSLTHLPATIQWTPDHQVRILDQRALPVTETYLDLSTVEEMAQAIETLAVRGAPLIGIAAAMGVVLATLDEPNAGAAVERAIDRLGATRPTAVNLHRALERMARRAADTDPGDLSEALLDEAKAIHDEDREMCHRIGEAGLALIPNQATIMTHCNAGALATGGIGTALAPVYLAHEQGRPLRVVVSETRPLLQGARLTAWEMSRAGIDCTLVTDSMSASRLAQGDVTAVIVGADRIAANGDVANKIGTLGLALLARHYGVPFYVAAPRSTFDPDVATGDDIPIEQRAAEEVREVGDSVVAAPVPVWNPAFDVTPAELVTAYVTDSGILTSDQVAGVGRSGGRVDGR